MQHNRDVYVWQSVTLLNTDQVNSSIISQADHQVVARWILFVHLDQQLQQETTTDSGSTWWHPRWVHWQGQAFTHQWSSTKTRHPWDPGGASVAEQTTAMIIQKKFHQHWCQWDERMCVWELKWRAQRSDFKSHSKKLCNMFRVSNICFGVEWIGYLLVLDCTAVIIVCAYRKSGGHMLSVIAL